MVQKPKTTRTLSAHQETPREEARRKMRARVLSRVDAAEDVVNAASAALAVLRDELDGVSGKSSLVTELLLAHTRARATFYETLLGSLEEREE